MNRNKINDTLSQIFLRKFSPKFNLFDVYSSEWKVNRVKLFEGTRLSFLYTFLRKEFLPRKRSSGRYRQGNVIAAKKLADASTASLYTGGGGGEWADADRNCALFTQQTRKCRQKGTNRHQLEASFPSFIFSVSHKNVAGGKGGAGELDRSLGDERKTLQREKFTKG